MRTSILTGRTANFNGSSRILPTEAPRTQSCVSRPLQVGKRSEHQCSLDAKHPESGSPSGKPECLDRREVFSRAVAAVAGVVAMGPQQQCSAAEMGDYLLKAFPPAPEPVLFPRKALDQRFAVLLMKSSYEAVDALDIVPMDKFQVKFWKLRQSEQEGYGMQYLPLKPRVGDLTDPLYFDFISFSQYAQISQDMRSPQLVFKEWCEDCVDNSRLVRRDASQAADDAQLPTSFYRLVGDQIYDGLLNGFREEVFGAPAPTKAGSSVAEVAANVQRILNIMVDRGYALKAEVVDISEGPSAGFRVKLQGSINLWGLAALNYRRSLVTNAFDAMVIDSYLRASGWQNASHELSCTSVGCEETWTLA